MILLDGLINKEASVFISLKHQNQINLITRWGGGAYFDAAGSE